MRLGHARAARAPRASPLFRTVFALLVTFSAARDAAAAPGAGDEPSCDSGKPNGAWSTEAADRIRSAEYRLSPSGDGVASAPNRANGFRATWSSASGEIEIRPRRAADAWSF